MGGPMARNLMKAGYRVIVSDLNKESINSLRTHGDVSSFETPAEISKEAKYVITMLPGSAAVEKVYLDPQHGLLKNVQTDSILIDASTIHPETAKKVHQSINTLNKNIQFVDAPVSGGTGGAAAGTLTFMVGGSQQALDLATPVLQAMGKNIVHCGENGAGQAAKICNNLLLGISMIGTSEAMNLGVSLGLDPTVLAKIINTSSGRCWSSEIYNPVPGVLENSAATRGYTGGFGSDLMKKDLGLAVAAAENANARMVLGKKSLEFYEELSKNGLGGKDFAVVYQQLRNDSSKPNKQ
eukprot:TRINITY_DN10874_c0_g1_i1.p1 TRINITY_DN10874_c0_g1~~TRINITY_DN10874_c0_g1_i1.p1  ORF type:complete len:344 (-),score=55.95 TRINITY_DN10874_c0_g1_i1:17-904(-)